MSVWVRQRTIAGNRRVVDMELHENDKGRVWIDGKLFTFEFDVRQAVVYDDLILILLDIPTKPEYAHYIRNLYGFRQGKRLWQVEDLNNQFPNRIHFPFEGIYIDNDGELGGTDFYGRRYAIDMETGAITKQLPSVK